MTRKERNDLLKWAKSLSDEELEKAFLEAYHDYLQSGCYDEMYELGYDEIDIEAQMETDKYLEDQCNILQKLCYDRGIDPYRVFKEK